MCGPTGDAPYNAHRPTHTHGCGRHIPYPLPWPPCTMRAGSRAARRGHAQARGNHYCRQAQRGLRPTDMRPGAAHSHSRGAPHRGPFFRCKNIRFRLRAGHIWPGGTLHGAGMRKRAAERGQCRQGRPPLPVPAPLFVVANPPGYAAGRYASTMPGIYNVWIHRGRALQCRSAAGPASPSVCWYPLWTPCNLGGAPNGYGDYMPLP